MKYSWDGGPGACQLLPADKEYSGVFAAWDPGSCPQDRVLLCEQGHSTQAALSPGHGEGTEGSEKVDVVTPCPSSPLPAVHSRQSQRVPTGHPLATTRPGPAACPSSIHQGHDS